MPPQAFRVRLAKGQPKRRAKQSNKSRTDLSSFSLSGRITESGIPGFRAARYRTKLFYYDNVTITSSAGAAGAYVFSANGLYDPDITGTGHQPMPFDQLMLSFEHYSVVSSRITVTFRNQSSSALATCAVSINASSTAITNYIQLAENGLLTRQRLDTANNANSMCSISKVINIAKFGSVPSLLSNPDYQGSLSANPGEQSYFHISAWNGFDTTAAEVICEVFIEYDAWFFEPRANSSSITAALKRLILAEQKSSQ